VKSISRWSSTALDIFGCQQRGGRRARAAVAWIQKGLGFGLGGRASILPTSPICPAVSSRLTPTAPHPLRCRGPAERAVRFHQLVRTGWATRRRGPMAATAPAISLYEAGHEQETNCLVTNYNLAFKREDKIPVARHPIVLM